MRLIGNLLILLSAIGFGWLLLGPPPEQLVRGAARPIPAVVAPAPDRVGAAPIPAGPALRNGPAPAVAQPSSTEPSPSGVAPRSAVPAPAPQPYIPAPITRVVVPAIGLDAEVVPARLIEQNGVTTWDVPKFKAGHAELTAGAGDVGNAVLLGHVQSRSSGNVFADLGAIQIGQEIAVFSRDGEFVYRVVDVRVVDRTDASPLRTTDTPMLTLVTCTGWFNPLIWEYTQRLVVQAELVEP